VALAGLFLVLGVGPAAYAGDVALPTDPQVEVQAQRPVPVPATASCSVVVSHHQFQNSYGAPDRETYTPPADCPGPWSKVVLTLTSTVSGTQFDRDVYVAIGNAVMLDGTTSEPCCTGNAVTWTVQRDVTSYSPLLTAEQPAVVELDNVNDSTYTGVYDTTVSLTFYDADATAPAAASPDAVFPISSSGGGGPMLGISKDGQRVGTDVTFPRNLTRLTAELFADAHGGCEEFWWSDPTNCAGTPYREVAVYLDGRLAGAAPTYPVTYTGADGPGLWEPIPSPRAWNIRPYDVDLTPFVGTLTDGAAHVVQLGVLGTQLASGDFWQTAANLFAWTDPNSAVTTGGLLSAITPAQPTISATSDPATGGGVAYHGQASHELSFSGFVTTAAGTTMTTVRNTMSATNSQVGVVEHGSWNWTTAITTDGDGHQTVDTATATYGITTGELASFTFTDDGTTSRAVDGRPAGSSTYIEKMSTEGATGIAYNGVEYDRYGYSDSTGACYDHLLSAQGGELTVDRVDGLCPGTTVPAALLPETRTPALLLVIALVIAGAAGCRRGNLAADAAGWCRRRWHPHGLRSGRR